MSNIDFTIATDPPEVDKTATIDIICRAQTDLHLLKDYVDTVHYPVLPELLVVALYGLSFYLRDFTPSHSRH